jgi:predicted house-cleaning noncanonical NTP pyrophosphatase (MazG superfamily)
MSDLPKLVRDKIPQIIREDGEKPEIERIEDEDVTEYLLDKIVEEAEELREDGDLDELADLMEVIDRYIEVEDIDEEDLYRLREDKNEKRGGFKDNIILEDVE